MIYRIGSFNMYKFQAYRSDKEISKDLNKVAEIIRTERFDIIALQEIFSKTAMDMLLIRLGCNWKGSWESPRSTSIQAAEGYAFLWNTDRIELAESVTVNGKRTYYPRIYNQYRVDRTKGQHTLVRNPYYGRFHPIHTFMEIRLINVHIMYSKNRDSTSDNIGDVRMRKNEIDTVVKSIYVKEADKRYGNNMPAYTLILGDYNLNLESSMASWPYVDEIIEVEEGQRIRRIKTVQEQLTTLRRANAQKKVQEQLTTLRRANAQKKEINNQEEMEDIYSINKFANNYDHFSYDEQRFDGIAILADRIDTLNKYLQNDVERHRKIISDHVPIVLNMNMRK